MKQNDSIAKNLAYAPANRRNLAQKTNVPYVGTRTARGYALNGSNASRLQGRNGLSSNIRPNQSPIDQQNSDDFNTSINGQGQAPNAVVPRVNTRAVRSYTLQADNRLSSNMRPNQSTIEQQNSDDFNTSINGQDTASKAVVPLVGTRTARGYALNGSNASRLQGRSGLASNVVPTQSTIEQQNASSLNASTKNKTDQASKRKRQSVTNMRIKSDQQSAIDFLTGNENSIRKASTKTQRYSKGRTD